MENRTAYSYSYTTQTIPASNTVVVEQQQPNVVHHVHHRRHRHHYYYGGGLLGAMARAVADDVYHPGYVVTEERSQPVQTTVQVTTNTSRSAPPPAAGFPPRQNAPPRPVPPRPVPPHPSTVPKPKILDCFKLGNVIELQSKMSGEKLMMDAEGLLSCSGSGGSACQFKVRSSGRPGVYKLQSVTQPRCYIGYFKGYIVGDGKGDKDCDFLVSSVQDHYVTLECCQHLGNVIGSLPSGDITDPSKTRKDSDVAQFAPHVISS